MLRSDYERKRFRELESDLAVDDSVLAREHATGTSPLPRFRWSASLVLALAGFGLLVLGSAAQLGGIGLLGFLLMSGRAVGYAGH